MRAKVIARGTKGYIVRGGGPERVVSTGEKGGEKGSRRLAHLIRSGCYRLYNAVGGAGGRECRGRGGNEMRTASGHNPPVPFLGLCRGEAGFESVVREAPRCPGIAHRTHLPPQAKGRRSGPGPDPQVAPKRGGPQFPAPQPTPVGGCSLFFHTVGPTTRLGLVGGYLCVGQNFLSSFAPPPLSGCSQNAPGQTVIQPPPPHHTVFMANPPIPPPPR